jgi:flagellar FliJ protein
MYKFNLESLLNHRKYTEEIRQKELAESKRLLSDERKKLRDYKIEKEKYWTQLQQKQKKGNPVSEIRVYLDYIQRLSKDIEDQRQRVLAAKKKNDQMRMALIEAMKKRKILDKLKAKGIKEYRQMTRKKEQDFMNEIAVNQHNRKG